MKASPSKTRNKTASRPRPGWAVRLAAARNSAGLTQEGLGKEIGASQSTVASWERGQNEPSLEMFQRLSRVLNTTAWELAFADDTIRSDWATILDDAMASSASPDRFNRAILLAKTIEHITRIMQEAGLANFLAPVGNESLIAARSQQLWLSMIDRVFKGSLVGATPIDQDKALREGLASAKARIDDLSRNLANALDQD